MEWNGMEWGATHQQSDSVRVENHPTNRRFWSEKTGDRLFPPKNQWVSPGLLQGGTPVR